MINNIIFILRYVIFWISFFFISRVLFIVFFLDNIKNYSLKEILHIFPNSIALDISFICYLLVPIILLIWTYSFLSLSHTLNKIIFYYTISWIIISGLVAGSEVALYSEWQTKLNFTAISHLHHPNEVFSTASTFHILTICIFLIVSIISAILYSVFVHNSLIILYKSTMLSIFTRCVSLPVIMGVLLLGIRGGFQPIPINLSDAYFSNQLILNDIAVNPNWNIGQSILKSRTNIRGNPYAEYSHDICNQFIDSLYHIHKDTTSFVLKTQHPNIIFILLESWSADNIESLGGLEGITPNFKGLEKDGILFTDFYSNGWTSDQGMSSIFSSFPVFPYVAIINQSDKSRRLPSLNKDLPSYHSSYFFGGQLTYGNIKGYLISNGFDLLKDENNYSSLPSGRLGVHDEYMFKAFEDELRDLPQPFLSALFTISSHSPYDFPAQHKLSFGSKEDAYVNSVAYTDQCLGDFFNSVKDEAWYDNTLFILVADHSHNSPRGWRLAQKERFRIPMLWYGEVLKDELKGTRYNKLGSHIDIAPTILSQLNIDDKSYQWGRNMFNHYEKASVPYAFHKGYGLIQPRGYYAFSEIYNKKLEYHYIDIQDAGKIKMSAEMFFQAAFQEYMDL